MDRNTFLFCFAYMKLPLFGLQATPGQSPPMTISDSTGGD